MISSNFSLSVSLSLVSASILDGISSLYYVCAGRPSSSLISFQAIDESVASMQTACSGFQAFRLQGDADYAFASMTISHYVVSMAISDHMPLNKPEV